MKRTLSFLFIAFIITTKSPAQNNTCNCLENLNRLIEKTEENYAGFPSKITEKIRPAYQALISNLQQKASYEQNPKTCFYLLRNYVKFFSDKHFILSYANEDDPDNEKIIYSEASFIKTISKKHIGAIEGIWVNADTSLKLAIQKFPNNVYKGIVLESKNPKLYRGLVYLTLTPTKKGFIAKEYNVFMTTDIPAKQKGNLLQIWNYNMFGKIYPTRLTSAEQKELNTWKNNNNGLDFQQLSSKTTYLKIPTFFNNDDKIQQLIIKNDSLIRNSENLIVDLTANAGGNTGWIAFLPYFMTNPIIQADTYVRVTPENIKSKLADIEPYVKNPIPGEYKKYFPDSTLRAYKKAYEELPTVKELFYPIPGVTFPLDSVTTSPKRIALMVDDFCGSSTEYFFFLSKQSKKTTTYGANTIGMMDYEGMSNPTPLPYNKYILTIPIVKSSWTDKKPIDQTGFTPEKNLDQIKQQDWVQYLLKDIETR